jgi:hypothetical protein
LITHKNIYLLLKFPTILSTYERAILKHFNTGTRGILKFALCPAVCTGAFVTDETHYVHKYTSPESDALLLQYVATYALFLTVNGQAWAV